MSTIIPYLNDDGSITHKCFFVWKKETTIEFFTGFPNLESLNLSCNVLHTVSDSAFNLPGLLTLDLSGNQLGVVQKSFFSSSTKLSEINLSR